MVDDIAAIAGQADSVAGFGRRAAWFGELACHPSDLDHWAGGSESEDHCHL